MIQSGLNNWRISRWSGLIITRPRYERNGQRYASDMFESDSEGLHLKNEAPKIGLQRHPVTYFLSFRYLLGSTLTDIFRFSETKKPTSSFIVIWAGIDDVVDASEFFPCRILPNLHLRQMMLTCPP